MTLGPLSECHNGTGNARGGWGRRNMGELAAVGHGKGAIRKVKEGSRRQVGVRACMPAAAGWPCGLISNDPRAGRTDPSLRVTTCAHLNES